MLCVYSLKACDGIKNLPYNNVMQVLFQIAQLQKLMIDGEQTACVIDLARRFLSIRRSIFVTE